MPRVTLEPLMNLARALEEEEQSPGNQNEIPAGERMTQQLKQRRGQADNPRQHGEQGDARDHGAGQTDAASASLLVPLEFSRKDGDENDVVDAEDDLQHRKRDETDEDFGHKRVAALKRERKPDLRVMRSHGGSHRGAPPRGR